MSWFKLTIPKGKRKKRAHKKWLKRTEVRAHLKKVEQIIEEEMTAFNFEEKLAWCLEGAAIHGVGTMIMLDGKEIIFSPFNQYEGGEDLGDIKDLQEILKQPL
jgi:hypothetical protein